MIWCFSGDLSQWHVSDGNITICLLLKTNKILRHLSRSGDRIVYRLQELFSCWHMVLFLLWTNADCTRKLHFYLLVCLLSYWQPSTENLSYKTTQILIWVIKALHVPLLVASEKINTLGGFNNFDLGYLRHYRYHCW